MPSYAAAQIAYEVATTHGLRRVLFGGFFIRANGFTMETIEFAINFWSKVRWPPQGRQPSQPPCAAVSI